MKSRLLDLVESGRIRDEAGLKRAFRALAKQVHPDAAGRASPEGGPAARAFIALREDFEAAEARLASLAASAPGGGAGGGRAGGPGKPRYATPNARPESYPFDRRALYESLEDIIARGFPERPRTAYPARLYDRSRRAVLAYLAGRDEIHPEAGIRAAFLAFEAAYAALPKAGFISPDNDERRGLYMLLANMLGFHRRGFRHEARAAKGLFPLVEERLGRAGAAAALPFLRFLAEDLDRGPAMCE